MDDFDETHLLKRPVYENFNDAFCCWDLYLSNGTYSNSYGFYNIFTHLTYFCALGVCPKLKYIKCKIIPEGALGPLSNRKEEPQIEMKNYNTNISKKNQNIDISTQSDYFLKLQLSQLKQYARTLKEETKLCQEKIKEVSDELVSRAKKFIDDNEAEIELTEEVTDEPSK